MLIYYNIKFMSKITQKLEDSRFIKIVLNSRYLPEVIYIWKVKTKVLPFINNVRKFQICSSWGHNGRVCKGKLTYTKCGENHTEAECNSQSVTCKNCQKEHYSFNNTSRFLNTLNWLTLFALMRSIPIGEKNN